MARSLYDRGLWHLTNWMPGNPRPNPSMRVCVVQAYGLGNAILTTPLVRALALAGHRVEVMLDKKRASWPVFDGWDEVDRVWNLYESSRGANDVVFDVALSESKGDSASGGVGVFFGAVSLGAKGTEEAQSASHTKVSFCVPILLPSGDKSP